AAQDTSDAMRHNPYTTGVAAADRPIAMARTVTAKRTPMQPRTNVSVTVRAFLAARPARRRRSWRDRRSGQSPLCPEPPPGSSGGRTCRGFLPHLLPWVEWLAATGLTARRACAGQCQGEIEPRGAELP